MPSITITCDNCGNLEDTTLWDADSWSSRCPQCGNDVCPRCKSRENEELHQDCVEYMKAEKES